MPAGATNAANSLAPFQAALSLLPYWDKTLTNTFSAGEFTLEAAPAWKTMTAAGNTPYVSVGGDYFFKRYLAIGGELLTFGNGQGSSSLDSALANLTLRKDIGNIAGYALIGAGYDFNTDRFVAALGPGITYRYSTGIGLFVDTRWTIEGTAKERNGWLTRVGVQLHF
ncbi:MAG: hypothetical protein C5B50_07875 [Verrucomicrobia bacterium]|nr:MAG: hypothetical protein C5B50_07875 [Verrucomicrobiota bacterium]